MRIAFSGTSFIGHLMPMVPLMRAFVARGHDVAVITSSSLQEFLHAEASPHIAVLPAGPLAGATMTGMLKRTGTSPAVEPRPPVIAEFFAGQLVDAGFESALAAVTEWRPDVVISEALDYVGALVAGELGTPFYRHTYGPTRPDVVMTALDIVFRHRALAMRRRAAPVSAWIDIYPEWLQDPAARVPGRRIAVRPELHRTPERPWTRPGGGSGADGQVLVSFGTVFTDATLRERVADSIDARRADLVITTGSVESLDVPPSTPGRSYVSFAPIGDLLHGADVVVTAGGAGTVLAALVQGVPLVIVPQGADHAINAARASAAGVALIVESPDDVGSAVSRLMSDPSYRTRSRLLAARIASLPAVGDVARQLEREVLDRVAGDSVAAG